MDFSPDFGRANLLELFPGFLMAFNRLSMTTGPGCYFQAIEQKTSRCMCVCVCATLQLLKDYGLISSVVFGEWFTGYAGCF